MRLLMKKLPWLMRMGSEIGNVKFLFGFFEIGCFLMGRILAEVYLYSANGFFCAQER